jgi:hypothetical protein
VLLAAIDIVETMLGQCLEEMQDITGNKECSS